MSKGSRFKKIFYTIAAVLLLIILLSYIGLFSIPETTQFNQTLPRTTIDGYSFHTENYGDPENPPLVVIHGGPGGDFPYLLNVKALSDEYNVLFYDQRGSGLSPRVDASNFTVDSFVEDLDKIVDYHGHGKKVILVGHSWGAMLATAYVSRYPQKVSKAVLMEPGMLNQNSAAAFLDKIKQTQSNLGLGQVFKASLIFTKSIFVKRKDAHEMKDYILTSMMGMGNGPPYQCPGESLPKGSFVRGGYAVFDSMIMPLMDHPEKFDYDLTKGINSFKGRILLLSSECSFIGYDYQKEYHQQLFGPNVIHTMMKQTGHNMITLKPKESIQIIRDFLNAR